LAMLLPGLADSNLWAFAPATLVVFATGILIFRGTYQGPSLESNKKSLFPPRQLQKIRYEPESEFALLPLNFTVDHTAQYPQVEVLFHVVSFLPRPIRLTEVELSLRLYNRPALEDITFRQKDFQIDPKDCEVIMCRRQLTDAERTALPPWQSGRVNNASYQLSAKATDGQRTFSFGPVSSRSIDGWVNVPSKTA